MSLWKKLTALVLTLALVTGGAALWDKVSGKYFRNGGKYRLAGGGKESPLNQGLLIIVR